jgi:hypothetical protein
MSLRNAGTDGTTAEEYVKARDEAARLVAEADWSPRESNGYGGWPTQKFSCWAINKAAGKRSYQFGPDDPVPPLVKRYQDVFKPEDGDWTWGDLWGELEAERDECRVLALCLMAAMVEAGDA